MKKFNEFTGQGTMKLGKAPLRTDKFQFHLSTALGVVFVSALAMPTLLYLSGARDYDPEFLARSFCLDAIGIFALTSMVMRDSREAVCSISFESVMLCAVGYYLPCGDNSQHMGHGAVPVSMIFTQYRSEPSLMTPFINQLVLFSAGILVLIVVRVLTYYWSPKPGVDTAPVQPQIIEHVE